MAGTLRELRVWQEAVALAGDVVRATRQHARRETRGFTDQLALIAASVATGIADGYVCMDADEQREAFRLARRALAQCETLLAIALGAGVLPAALHSQLAARAGNLGRLLSGYLSYVERE